MRQRSASAARRQRERVAYLRRTDADRARCQWPHGCTERAVDAHESRNRSQGGDATRPDWLLCRRHHDEVGVAVGEFRAWCIAQGLITVRKPLHSVPQRATLAGVPQSPHLAVRIPVTADQFIRDLMKATSATRTTVVRAMLRVAVDHRDDVVRRVNNYRKAEL